MLTLGELKSKQPEPKKKRYDKADMDEYLELIFKNYEETYERCLDLKKKVKTLSDGVQYYRSIETTLQQALILAEKTSKETKDAAVLKAEAIEKEAAVKADEIINNAEQEYIHIKQESIHLVKQFNQYKMQLKQAANAQIELIDSDIFDIYSPELSKLYHENELQLQAKETTFADKRNPEPVFNEELPSPKEENAAVNESFTEHLTESEDNDKKENAVSHESFTEKENFHRDKNLTTSEITMDNAEETDMILDDPLHFEEASSQEPPVKNAEPIVLEPVTGVTSEPIEANVLNFDDTQPLEPIAVKEADLDGKASIPNIEHIPVKESTSISRIDNIPVKESIPIRERMAAEENMQTAGKELQTLDGLLKDLNIGNQNRAEDENSSENDPFDFLGPIEGDGF